MSDFVRDLLVALLTVGNAKIVFPGRPGHHYRCKPPFNAAAEATASSSARRFEKDF